MMTILVGIIAEDESDVEVLEKIIRRYKRPRPISVQKVALGGCARLRAKCKTYAKNLAERGCTRLIVVHDADNRTTEELQSLHAELTQAIVECKITMKVVILPVREIEAWLLADTQAIKRALKIKRPIKRIPNPEAIRRPKEYLRDGVFRWSDKKTRYYNTIHNAKIAEVCSPVALNACKSFRALDEFIRTSC